MKGESELMMMDVRSANQSPQSVSSGIDSGIDSLLDQISDLPHVAISLCGGLTDNREITRGKNRICPKTEAFVDALVFLSFASIPFCYIFKSNCQN